MCLALHSHWLTHPYVRTRDVQHLLVRFAESFHRNGDFIHCLKLNDIGVSIEKISYIKCRRIQKRNVCH